MVHAFIGTSGWNYKHWWNNEFYPKDLKASDWLKYFVRHFDTVELNNSFYRLPSEVAFQNWRIQVPPHFVFSVKARLKRGMQHGSFLRFSTRFANTASRSALRTGETRTLPNL